ncbi:MAG: aminoacyl-tRNA hydrolase [Candidatus Moraniibacteriota bacterium]
MILILGLGNPGEKYEHTRHNVGFLFLDFLREAWRLPAFAPSHRFESLLSKGEWNGHSILLGKPETYMNLSGKPVGSLLRYYKLNEKNLAVIHDDLDIARGALRSTHSSSAAGHNGVIDIIERIGTQDFFRIRIGIGRPLGEPRLLVGKSEDHIPTKDFVLLPLPHEEYATLHDVVFPRAKEILEEWVSKQA